MSESSWEYEEGEAIAPGIYAVRLLGGGHRYEAYLAWHDDMHALVVAKVLRPDIANEAWAREAIAREAHALTTLAHPAIVRAFDADPEDDPPRLVLEYLDGPRLSTLARRYEVNVEQTLFLALELASALHYMGRRGFVHLDVKPRNIIMTASPRLIDLSVAARLDSLGHLRSAVGTDAYMAPEQCLPERFGEIEHRTDVWGLGVTLWELAAREMPFRAPGPDSAPPHERYPQVHAAPAPMPSRVPKALGELLLSCLEKRPGDRPTAAEVSAVVEPWADTVPRPRFGIFRPGGRSRGQVQIR